VRVTDYIVDFLITKKITDVFGYPGGMVTYLMDSFSKQQVKIKSHANYNEQGSSFAACGYAQVACNTGVAFATSGPGATNLITGLCNAYFDSIPVIFITGQVNDYETKGDSKVRQKGFQETDIVSMVKDVTKYAVNISEANVVRYHLEKAYALSLEGRPGPVLLDIPMNIQRSEIEPELLPGYQPKTSPSNKTAAETILQSLEHAERPCLLIGAGVVQSGMRSILRLLVDELKIPVITSMIAIDTIPTASPYNFGFIGAYGLRYANMILSKCDLLITLGSRLDVRQTGANSDAFAVNARLIRIDIDTNELSNKIKPDEIQVLGDLKEIIPALNALANKSNIDFGSKYSKWITLCTDIKNMLINKDHLHPNSIMQRISMLMPDHSIITADVGQNQVWVAQSFKVKNDQRILFSGGHGAMGYSLPAAIGAFFGSKGKKIFSINGDGGFQMNMQELQFIAREKLPITVIVFNNKALGMIRHFQEMYFNANYSLTVAGRGYETPDFSLIAKAYALDYHLIKNLEDIHEYMFAGNNPSLIEIDLSEETYVFPKLAINKPIHDQEPPLDRELYQLIMNL